VDYDPISVALKFGFLAVLYLFLLWIARSALKDLRGTVAPAPDATGFHPVPSYEAAAGGDAWLVALRGGGLAEGERFDLIVRKENFFLPQVQDFMALLRGDDFHQMAASLKGYDLADSGRVEG